MSVSPQTFRETFRAFSDPTRFPDSLITFYLELANMMLPASRWGGLLDYGSQLFAAHHLALEEKAQQESELGSAPGSGVGVIGSKGAGPVSLSLDTTLAAEQGAGFWNMTVYGLRFYRLVRMVGLGGIQLGAPRPSGALVVAPPTPVDLPQVYFYAPAYGGIWDSTHDVGDAIQKAIIAAAAAGGGSVVIPAGHFGQTVPIINNNNGVHIVAQGLGIPRPVNHGQAFQAATELIWIGAPDATMYTSTIPGDQQWSADVTGILFNCNNLAAVGAHFTHVSFSTFYVGASDARQIGIWMDTQAILTGPGNQNNEVWFFSRSVSPNNTYAPTGILLDSGPGSNFNTSGNNFHVLSAWYARGDGIVLGNTDNNLIFNTGTFPNPGNATGRPVVFASSNYVMPNGLMTNGSARANISYHNELVTVLGYVSASTITPGANAGNAAVRSITLITNDVTNAQNVTLHFADTTGVTLGMSVSGGGTNSGIMSGSTVGTFTSTTVVMEQGSVGTVASGTPITFGFGVTRFAATGTYTLTAVDATHWNVVAPVKGNSQTNVAVVGGVLIATDMVIPLTGSPVAGDTFVVVVPTPAKDISIFGLDRENSAPFPLVEPGANAFMTRTSSPFPIPIRGTGNVPFIPILGTINSFSGGGSFSGASGVNSGQIAGVAASATGFGALVTGHNTVSSSFWSFAGGEFNWADGFSTRTFGSHGTARQRYNADTWGAAGANLGDLQRTSQPLSILTTDATPTRLTADRAAPSAINTMNMVPHSAFLITVAIIAHQIGGSAGTRDDTATWSAAVLMKQGADASTTEFVAGYHVANTTLVNAAIAENVGFAPSLGNSAASAWTITIGADKINGGFAVSGTGEVNKDIEWLCETVSIENVN